MRAKEVGRGQVFADHREAFGFFFCLLGPYQCHMEVPRLGVKSELQLPAYDVTATATLHPSLICDLYHSSPPHWILNPLSEARDPTCPQIF